MILNPNDKAPFYGVLVSEDVYREYQYLADAQELTQASLETCDKQRLLEATSHDPDPWVNRIMGLSFGMLLGVIVGTLTR